LLDAPQSEELRRGLLEDALALEERALSSRSDDPACRMLRLRTLASLANAYYWLGRYEEGAGVAAEAAREGEQLARAQLLEGDGVIELARAQHLRAKCLLERKELPAALEASRAALAGLERESAPERVAGQLAQFLVVHANLLGRTGDPEGELAAQRRAIELLQRRSAEGAVDATTACDLVRFHCGLSRIHLRRGEQELAESALREAQRYAERSSAVGEEERGLVQRRLGQLFAATERPREALLAYASAIASLERELAAQPGRELVRYQLALDRCASAEQRSALGEHGPAREDARAAIAAAEALAPHFAGRAWKLGEILRRSAVACSEGAPSEPREPLLEAQSWLERALALATESAVVAGDAARLAQLRFQASVDRGLLAEQLGSPLSAAAWEEIVALGAASSEASYRELAAAALEAARAR
jgi:tetratricopeptide (TPR) repeat protein